MKTAEARRGTFFAPRFLVTRRIENLVAALEISLQRANRGAADRHHPLLAALAEHDDDAGREIHLMQLQSDQLRNAQPASVGHFEHRTIAQSASVVGVDRGDEIFDVARRERAREFARMRPQLHRRRRIALDDLLVDQLARQTAQAGEMAALRADRKALVRQRFEVCGQRRGVELRGLQARLAAP